MQRIRSHRGEHLRQSGAGRRCLAHRHPAMSGCRVGVDDASRPTQPATKGGRLPAISISGVGPFLRVSASARNEWRLVARTSATASCPTRRPSMKTADSLVHDPVSCHTDQAGFRSCWYAPPANAPEPSFRRVVPDGYACSHEGHSRPQVDSATETQHVRRRVQPALAIGLLRLPDTRGPRSGRCGDGRLPWSTKPPGHAGVFAASGRP